MYFNHKSIFLIISTLSWIIILLLVSIGSKHKHISARKNKNCQPKYNVFERIKNYTKCFDRPMESKIQQRGNYWVLYNYITAERQFRCEESVTYTTHADYSYLDNLVPLLERWRGPISIAIYAPGSDFEATIESINYLRECTNYLVKQLVTFHIYFDTKHMPKEVFKSKQKFTKPYNCSLVPPYLKSSSIKKYRKQKKLFYPLNVGRNIAREMAQTYYILTSDIELYPSLNIPKRFLEMIATQPKELLSANPKVFPLAIFEITANSSIPKNKTKVIDMLKNKTAFPFHEKVCSRCHNFPNATGWRKAPETKDFHIFKVGKRNGWFLFWEPIYIGTHMDPLYDERQSWEGKFDKMTQGFVLCVLDYDFLILNNAFLVHKPGIKAFNASNYELSRSRAMEELRNKIKTELTILYGDREGCV